MPQRKPPARGAGCEGPEVYLTPDLLEDLRARLARIEGHIRGVRRMLERKEDCDDILTQVSAVQSALREVARLLLEGHLETCVAEALRSGDGTLPVERFKESLSRVLRSG